MVVKYLGEHAPIPSYPKDIDPRAVSVGNSTEMMINISGFLRTNIIYNSFEDLPKRKSLFLRAGVLNKLIRVSGSLPNNFGLVIYDGHRNLNFQVELLQHFLNKNPELKNGFVSDPSDTRLAAPHTTGGAVDLSLTYKGVPLDLGTTYDSFEPRAAVDALEGTPSSESEVSQLRRLLYHSMIAEGFAPYPLEWWHWSYGDQWWAAFYGESESLYNTVELKY